MTPSDAALLNAALRHLQAGRLSDAEQVLRQVLSRHPDDPDAVHLMGLVALQRGKLPEADYLPMRDAMEREAAAVLAEIEDLEKH